MMDIHPKGIHAGDQYGTTIPKSKPAIDFPKKQSIPGYGKQIKPVKPHGGDQFGTTIEKSKPFKQWPNADVKMRTTNVPQKGSAIHITSNKVVASATKDGMDIKKWNGATKKTASAMGAGGPTDRPYPLSTRYPCKNGLSDMTPSQFQDA